MGFFIRMVRVILQLLWHLFMILFRTMTPRIIRVLQFAIRLMVVSASSAFTGIPKTAEIIAMDWTEKAISHGIPPDKDMELHRIFLPLAYLTIGSGFLTAAFTIVFIVTWAF